MAIRAKDPKPTTENESQTETLTCSHRCLSSEETLLASCFNKSNFQKRMKDMLTSKWHMLNHNCQKFNAIVKRFKRMDGRIGENELDFMSHARNAYREEVKGGRLFSQEDA